MNKLRDTIKDLRNNNIFILDLMVFDELDAQLGYSEDNEEEFAELFEIVKYAYLKAENIDLHEIVSYCVEHPKEVKNMNAYEILENCLCY